MKICQTSPESVILSAIKKYVEFIAPTYGPAGKKTLIVHNEFNIEAVDDGKRSIQAFEIEDELEDAVIRYVKETTEKGKDGTTTAGLIMGNIVIEAFKEANNDDPMMGKRDYHGLVVGLKKGLEEAVKIVSKSSKKLKTEDELYAIAYNSYNNDKIAKLIAKTVYEIGKDGILTIEDAKGTETIVEIVNGVELPKGYASPHFVNNGGKVILEEPAILVINKKVNSFSDLIGIISHPIPPNPMNPLGGREFNYKDIVIVAESFGEDCLDKLAKYKYVGMVRPLLVETPGVGDKAENLQDLAAIVGAKVVDDKLLKLADVKPEHFGSCELVKSTKDKTVFLGGKGNTKLHIENLKAILENSTNNFEKEKLTKRIAVLSGGVAVIKVGAYTENEQKGMKTKVENAVNSAQIAFKGGVVAGAGKTLAGIETTSELLNKALKAPREQLEINGAQYLDEDAVDPTDVVVTALQTGVSIASGLLEFGGISVPKREKKEDKVAY